MESMMIRATTATGELSGVRAGGNRGLGATVSPSGWGSRTPNRLLRSTMLRASAPLRVGRLKAASHSDRLPSLLAGACSAWGGRLVAASSGLRDVCVALPAYDRGSGAAGPPVVRGP